MDDTLTVDIAGLDELNRALRALPPAVAGPVIAKATLESADVILEAALLKIHDRTGELSRRTTARIQDTNYAYARAVVQSSAPHAYLVEFGHRLVRAVRIITGRRGGRRVAEAKVIGQVPPHPFLRPAFDERGQEAVEVLKLRLGEYIEQAWDTGKPPGVGNL